MNPSAGNEDEVDLGMSEEPEQVLPEQRIAALGGIEEMGPEHAVELHEVGGEHHHRHREDDHDRRDELTPTRTAACGRSVMPGARSFRMVVVMSTATIRPIASL